MRRHKRFALGTLLAVAGLLLASTSPPASAMGSGSESFRGALVVSYPSGTRHVVATVVALRGIFNGVGKIVERDNQPGDDPVLDSRDDLVFAVGTLHIKNTNLTFVPSLNPVTCTFSVTITQTIVTAGGTRRFAHAHAHGTFAGTVQSHAIGQRAPDGTCSHDLPFLIELDVVSGTGKLTL